MGVEGLDTRENSLQAVVSRNHLTGGASAVTIQGAGGAGSPQQNTVKIRLHDNAVDTPPEQAIMISDGRTGNLVEVLEGSQTYMRTDRDLLK